MPTCYIKDFNPHSMYVTPVETSEICTIIIGMKGSRAGWGGIHAKIVK